MEMDVAFSYTVCVCVCVVQGPPPSLMCLLFAGRYVPVHPYFALLSPFLQVRGKADVTTGSLEKMLICQARIITTTLQHHS